MLLGFKTELKLNKSQRVLLSKHAGTARHAWNWGLGLTKVYLISSYAALFLSAKIISRLSVDVKH